MGPVYNVTGMWKGKKSFSLIELLVTMGVMAVIAAGVTATIGRAPRERARDGRRQSDVERIRSELEIFRNTSTAMSYPTALTALSMTGGVPADPLAGRTYGYVASPALCDGTSGNRCTTYVLCAALERVTGAAAVCTTAGANCTATCSYGTQNP